MTTTVHSYDFLLQWDHAGTTYYFSMFAATTTGGHTYSPRIVKADSVGGIYIDRTYADWQSASFTLDDLDDEWGTDFYFTALNAVDDFEDTEVRFYLYDRATDTKTEMFVGLVKRPKFDVDGTCQFEATFPVDAVECQIPQWTLGRRCVHFFPPELAAGLPVFGCTWSAGVQGLSGDYPDATEERCDRGLKTPNGCEAHNNVSEFGGLTHLRFGGQELDVDDIREQVVPIVIGDGPFKVRPLIYRAEIRGSELWVNGIISSTHPDLPFEESQFAPERFKLWGEIRASAVKVFLGTRPQEIPGSRDNFPEAVGHSLWCYFFARFALTPEQKDRAENADLKDDVVVKIDGGRPTLAGVRTQNPVRATMDVIKDRINGAGWPDARIDLTSVTDAANFVSTRFRGAYRFKKAQSFMDWLQEMLGSWHGYVSYEAGKLRVGAKRDDETAVATFGTGGLTICDGVTPSEKDFGDLTSGVLFRYKDEMNRGHRIPRRDVGAQTKAANGGPVKAEWEKVFLPGIFDEVEARISSAIWMREELNLDYFIEFATPLPDWISSGVRAGDVIRVNDPRIVDNADNYLFRVTGWTLDPETFEVTISAQFYEGAVYAYNEDELGDILRDGEAPSTGGRPADMENCTAEIVDRYIDEGDPDNTDDDTPMVRIATHAEYPDLSAEQAEDHAEGVTPDRAEYPITGYQLYWRFSNEPALHFHKGPFVKYPETEGELEVEFHRKLSVQILFASVARNNHTGEVGYVLDPLRTTYLDEDVDDTEVDIDVGDPSVFDDITEDEYVRCEGEFMSLASASGDTLTMVDDAGARAPQLGSDALEHPEGTEIGVAKLSHPSVTVPMSPHRFTLPDMTGLVARRRKDGLRYHCDHPPLDSPVHKWVYWSLDPNAFGLDADVSEVIAPDWYLADPENPPEAGYEIVPGDPGGEGGAGTSYFADDFSGPPCSGGSGPEYDDCLCDPWIQLGNVPFGIFSPSAGYDRCANVYRTLAWDVNADPLRHMETGETCLAVVEVPSPNSFKFGATLAGPVKDVDNATTLQGGWQLAFGVGIGTGGHYYQIKLRRGYFPFGPPGFTYTCYVIEQDGSGFPIIRSVHHFNVWPTWVEVAVRPPAGLETGDAYLSVRFDGTDVITDFGVTSGIATPTETSNFVGIMDEYTSRDATTAIADDGTGNVYDDFYAATLDYDPGSPPTDPVTLVYGIGLIKNHDNRLLLEWEEIEAAGGSDGSVVHARGVFHHKRNWSAHLSAEATKKHSRGPLCTPDAPSEDTVTITENVTDGTGADVTFRILHVCPDDTAETASEADVDKVILKFRKPSDHSKKKKKTYNLDDEDDALAYIDVPTEWKHSGVEWELYRVVYRNSDGKRVSADGSLIFTTGGFAPADAGGGPPTGIGASGLLLVASDPPVGLSIPCAVSFSQGDPVSLPVTLTIEVKEFGDADTEYLITLSESLSGAVDDGGDPLTDAGAHTITRAVHVPDYGTHYELRATVSFEGGDPLVDTDDATTTGTPGGGGGGSGLADGDYGDVVVSSSGAAINIDSAVLSSYGRTLIDDPDATTARGTLGLGTAATLDSDADATLAANSNSLLPTQAAVRAFVFARLNGLSWKGAVRAATTVHQALATAYENGDVIDGVTLATGDRILIKNQLPQSENGIYVVQASGAPVRAEDADSASELVNATVYVSEGTTLADTQWTCTTDAPIVVGTSGILWAQSSSGGIPDGDYGDVVITGGVWAIDSSVLSAFGRTLADDADAAAARMTLGLGSAAVLASDTDVLLSANSDSNLATQKAVKAYVDAAVAALTLKQPVRVATTAAGTLATSFENGDTVDGIVLATGDRILIKDQASGAENGIYVVQASGSPVRSTDADSGPEFISAIVNVLQGTVNAGTQWICTTGGTIVVNTTPIAWAQTSSNWGVRQSTVVTTGSLANLAEETGTVALGKSIEMITIQADRACRVRLYSTAAGRTADATREVTTPATDGLGCITDPVFSAAGTLIAPPGARGSNCDVTPTTTMYYAIQNRSGAPSTVQVTFTYLRTE